MSMVATPARTRGHGHEWSRRSMWPLGVPLLDSLGGSMRSKLQLCRCSKVKSLFADLRHGPAAPCSPRPVPVQLPPPPGAAAAAPPGSRAAGRSAFVSAPHRDGRCTDGCRPAPSPSGIHADPVAPPWSRTFSSGAEVEPANVHRMRSSAARIPRATAATSALHVNGSTAIGSANPTARRSLLEAYMPPGSLVTMFR